MKKKTKLTPEQIQEVDAFMAFMHDAYGLDASSLALSIVSLYYVPKSKMEFKAKLKRQEAGLHNLMKEL